MSPELDPERLGDHIDRLFRAAWALCGSREDAEDLVQETFVRVLARPRWLRSDEDLGYLLRVLRNTHLTRVRDAGRRIAPVPIADDVDRVPDPTGAGPESALATREVLDEVAALPDGYRDVIVAVDLVGLSYKEAARVLGTREGTVMSRLFRARSRVAAAVGADAP